MVVHLRVQRSFRERPFQLVDEAILAQGSLRITAGQELVVPVHGRETPICAYAAMGSWPI
jgi:hypothetical protein